MTEYPFSDASDADEQAIPLDATISDRRASPVATLALSVVAGVSSVGVVIASVWGVMPAAGVTMTACTLAGFLSRRSWLCELAAHFRVQYLVAATLLAIASLLMRDAWQAAGFGAVVAVNLAVIVPLYVSRAPRVSGPTSALRLLQANVYAPNDRYHLMLESVRRHDPDVVLFEEVSAAWLDRLRALSGRYPHVVAEAREDNFGIALFSRVPIADARVVYLGEVPAIVAELRLSGGAVTLIGAHPFPPVSPWYARRRDEQMAELARLARRLSTPVVVLGDFNVTAWPDSFAQMLADGDLYDSSRGFGPQPSWPAQLAPLRIPIDHCLHSAGVGVVDRRLGAFNGSDHYPLILDLEVGAARSEIANA